MTQNLRQTTAPEIKRMQKEMLECYPPAVELPQETRTGVRGHVVEGDLLIDRIEREQAT